MTWQDIAATYAWTGVLLIIPMAILLIAGSWQIGEYGASRKVGALLLTLGWALVVAVLVCWFTALLTTGFNGGLA